MFAVGGQHFIARVQVEARSDRGQRFAAAAREQNFVRVTTDEGGKGRGQARCFGAPLSIGHRGNVQAL